MRRQNWVAVIAVLLALSLTTVGCSATESTTTSLDAGSTTTVTLPETVPEGQGDGEQAGGGQDLAQILDNTDEFDNQQVTTTGVVVQTFEDDDAAFIMGVPGAGTPSEPVDPAAGNFVLVVGEAETIPDGLETGQTVEVSGLFQFFTGHPILGEANPTGLEAWDGRPSIVAEQVTAQ